MSNAHLIVEDLAVQFQQAVQPAVGGLSFKLSPGQTVALVGESGSGKSVTARSLIGLAGPNAKVTARHLNFNGEDLTRATERRWRALRGKEIGFVLQDALVSLDPLRRVGQEIEESLAAHRWGNRRTRPIRAVEMLERVGMPDATFRTSQRPDQLSGGLRQRALIASALALEPTILIADEPTTALDATVQEQILKLLSSLKARGHGLLLISHDLAVVSRLADEVIVLQNGQVVEQGETTQVLTRPRHSYTQSLLDAVPGAHRKGTRLSPGAGIVPVSNRAIEPQIVLEAKHITKHFPGPGGMPRIAVDDVSFTLRQGKTLGIVGESGSGKTTAARIALGLLTPDQGVVNFENTAWNTALPNAVSERSRRQRRQALGVIYQDPLSSFDPRWTVGQILSDALDAADLPRTKHREQTETLLQRVRLDPAMALRRPLQMSGGQRQRVAIARAIAGNPRVIICDEPVSALDVSVQAQVLDLLADLQAELGLAYLFISHDLGVIRHISDDILVMLNGRVVEHGETEAIFSKPNHDFTKRLLAATAGVST